MPILRPEKPAFANGAERDVWQLLHDQLRPDDVLLSGLRVTDEKKDHEADNVVVLPGAGVVVVEVKGGSVWHDGEHWWQHRGGTDNVIDPVAQARDTKYALRRFVESDPRWRAKGCGRLRWGHAVVLPQTALPDGFELPDCPRSIATDRSELEDLAGRLWDIPVRQESNNAVPDEKDALLIAEILRGRGLGMRSQFSVTDERESDVRRLTEEQAIILDVTRLIPRVEVRGGAGSGKTWLALEAARQQSRAGKRVALLCYSRGLATYLRRTAERWPRNEQPSFVGTFHYLGTGWGAGLQPDDADPDFWEDRMPREMEQRAHELPHGEKFDSIVIDEAQDFAELWWPVVLAALKDPDAGALFVCSDDGQRIFTRSAAPPMPLVPLLLANNMRNTRQIADTFNPIAATRMRLIGGDGPDVRFVPCPASEALDCADSEVEKLLAEEWQPVDIALLATRNRHPVQIERQNDGADSYWESFWATDDIFYGHVLGFKGLERPAVVLAVNDARVDERTRERLYVGMSRARDQLVVCGDPELIREAAGDAVLKRLQHTGR